MTNENYTTQDYGLANWLVYNKITLIGAVAYPNETRKSFVFIWSDSIPQLEEEWGPPFSVPNTELARTCKKFFAAHSIIKKALKESMDVQ